MPIYHHGPQLIVSRQEAYETTGFGLIKTKSTLYLSSLIFTYLF
jgi:hypothetical protein